MDLEHLREYTRILADELDAAPEGVFTDAELNIVLNVSKDNVFMDLVDLIPHRFRKSVNISLVASQEEYELAAAGDIVVENVMAIEVIIRTVSGKKPWPLIEITPEMDHQFMANPTETDTYPVAWRWSQKDNIVFRRIPSAAITNFAKMLYFEEIADLAEDDDEPDLPRMAHPLICLDALRQWGIRTAEGSAAVENRYQEMLQKVVQKYSLKSALRGGQLPGTIEMSGYGEDYVDES